MKLKHSELNEQEKVIAKLLKPLFTIYTNVTDSEILVSRYAEELAKIYKTEKDAELFELVIESCIRKCKRFPSIAEILEVGEDYVKNNYYNIIL